MTKKILISFLCFSVLFNGCYKNQKEEKKDLHKIEKKIEEQPVFSATQKRLLEEHNKQRESKGIKPLIISKELCDYAQSHAEKMSNKNKLYHSQISKLQENGASAVGENVAWGQNSEEEVVNSWMWSPMHRWNILGKSYKKAGFGASKDKKGRIYWCTVFTN